MATADRTYVDPSALLKLYLHEPQSRAMSTWRARTSGALPLTPHGRLEMVNAIGLAAFRKAISAEAAIDALASLDEDLEDGRYTMTEGLWRPTLRRAESLARRYTATIGCRTLDVLHVAAALELGSTAFVTFDARQRRLAGKAGLRSISPGGRE